MNRWHSLAAGLSFFSLSAIAGCSSTPVRDTKAPVSIDGWCTAVTNKLCDLTAKACHGGSMDFANSCKDNGIANCNAGRDPNTPSGRTTGDLDQCLAKLEPLSCQDLQGMTKNPEIVSACSASAPGPSEAAPAATAAPTSSEAAPPATAAPTSSEATPPATAAPAPSP